MPSLQREPPAGSFGDAVSNPLIDPPNTPLNRPPEKFDICQQTNGALCSRFGDNGCLPDALQRSRRPLQRACSGGMKRICARLTRRRIAIPVALLRPTFSPAPARGAAVKCIPSGKRAPPWVCGSTRMWRIPSYGRTTSRTASVCLAQFRRQAANGLLPGQGRVRPPACARLAQCAAGVLRQAGGGAWRRSGRPAGSRVGEPGLQLCFGGVPPAHRGVRMCADREPGSKGVPLSTRMPGEDLWRARCPPSQENRFPCTYVARAFASRARACWGVRMCADAFDGHARRRRRRPPRSRGTERRVLYTSGVVRTRALGCADCADCTDCTDCTDVRGRVGFLRDFRAAAARPVYGRVRFSPRMRQRHQNT